MTQREIHYEIHRRQSSQHGWSLHEVVLVRETALEIAHELIAAHRVNGVRVTKETFDPDSGDFLSLKIFEEGHAQARADVSSEEAPHALPCLTVDDLYAPPARAIMARLLGDFLVQHRLTISELLHRPDMVEKLEATGTVWQHAMQKIAVAQAATTRLPVQQIMKSLDKLATDAAHRLHRDLRSGRLSAVNQSGFAAFAASVPHDAETGYRLNVGIAACLASASAWKEKLAILMALLAASPEKLRPIVAPCIDAIVAELLATESALHELLGRPQDLGQMLTLLIDLALADAGGAIGSELEGLRPHFARDHLPLARTAIIARVLAELKSLRRLCPSVEAELELMRGLAQKLVLCQGKYLSAGDITAAFMLRSRRFVSQEYVDELLSRAANPEEKLERLLRLEESIVGVESRKRLAEFAHALVGSLQFETAFQNAEDPVLVRLRHIAQMQLRIRSSRLQEGDRNELADVLDRRACQIEANAHLLETLAQKLPEPAARLNALLKLHLAGVLTEGRLSQKTRDLVLRAIGTPGFFQAYLKTQANAGQTADAQRAMEGLLRSLEKIGIPQDRGLGLISA
ncbi:MAG TPA: hypothetical protein VGF97_17365 [Rhizomicrobium sp.]